MTRRIAAVIGVAIGLLLAVWKPDAKAHVPGCHTSACDRRIHEKRRRHWCRTHVWECRWHRVHPSLRARLARLRWCESRNNYRAVNGQYTGGYQYGPNAAARAGFRGAAMYASPREQDVRTAWFFPAHAGEWECRA